MKTTRVTKKLRLAGEVLAGERFCDSDDQFVVELVKKGKITTGQVYRALHHFGYRWQREKWRLIYPAWIINSHRWQRNEDHRILQGKR